MYEGSLDLKRLSNFFFSVYSVLGFVGVSWCTCEGEVGGEVAGVTPLQESQGEDHMTAVSLVVSASMHTEPPCFRSKASCPFARSKLSEVRERLLEQALSPQPVLLTAWALKVLDTRWDLI